MILKKSLTCPIDWDNVICSSCEMVHIYLVHIILIYRAALTKPNTFVSLLGQDDVPVKRFIN